MGPRMGSRYPTARCPWRSSGPADLQEILDDAASNGAIIIVSACYSGVFLDALEERHDADHHGGRCGAQLLRLRRQPRSHLVRGGLPEGLAAQGGLARGGLQEGRRTDPAARDGRAPDPLQPRSCSWVRSCAEAARTLPAARTAAACPRQQRNPDRIGYNCPMPTVSKHGRPVPLSVVILAAGEGKRMKSACPKVLQPLAGRPLLKHVIDTAGRSSPLRSTLCTDTAASRCARLSPRRAAAGAPPCRGPCRPSGSGPATRSPRRCPTFRTISAFWSSTATCRSSSDPRCRRCSPWRGPSRSRCSP